MANKGKNSNYKYKLKQELIEAEKKELEFRESRKKLYMWLNIIPIILVVISIVFAALYFNQVWVNADLVFLPLLGIATLVMAFRWQNSSRRIFVFMNMVGIVELALSVLIIYTKIKGGLL